MTFQRSSFLFLLLAATVAAYPFEFSFTIEGPHEACNNRDLRIIMHGIEDIIDHKGTEYLRDQGYSGFLDSLEVHISGGLGQAVTADNDDSMTWGPFFGEGRCESCPKDDQDSFYFRRRTFDGKSMSKQRITDSINQHLQADLAHIVAVRGSPDCSASSKQWNAKFEWL